MNINDLLSSIQSVAPELSTSFCIVNGALMRLDEIEKMGYREFWLRSKLIKTNHQWRTTSGIFISMELCGKVLIGLTRMSGDCCFRWEGQTSFCLFQISFHCRVRFCMIFIAVIFEKIIDHIFLRDLILPADQKGFDFPGLQQLSGVLGFDASQHGAQVSDLHDIRIILKMIHPIFSCHIVHLQV